MKPSMSRRRFLQVGAAAGGGLLISFNLTGCKRSDERAEPPSEQAVGTAATKESKRAPGLAQNAFIKIGRDGIVTLIVHKAEMGQGVFTSMPMLLAEELEVDLAKVKLEHAPANNSLYSDPLLGGQVTGGSTSVRGAWKPLREAGATARAVLVQAAAQTWQVDAATCSAKNGAVVHAASGRSLHYGELVDAAAKLDPPAVIRLKKPEEFTLIGTPLKRLDSVAKINGTAQFGIDAKLPGMLVATVAASPVPGGKLKGTNDQAAMAVKGVRQVLKLDNAVAVVGDHMWAAKQGLAALAPTWDDGPNANVTIDAIRTTMNEAAKKAGATGENKGDAVKALAMQEGGRKIEAVYEVPFLAHATMEPMNCTVDLRADGCDLYVGTQVPTFAQGAAAKLTGLPPEKVRVHNFYIGGGFGRRLEVDNVVQAVSFAKLMKAPVKFIWTREEDIQHDMYRPYYIDHLSARLGKDGRPAAWFHKVTGSSIMARFAPDAVKDGVDPDAVEGARDLQYTIGDMRVEYVRHEPSLATAFWRGVGPTHNVFVVESFMDELALAAGQDPVAYRRALLDKSPRMLGVLNLVAEKSGWTSKLKPVAGRRVGRGVSAQFAFGTYMAQVAEVSVGADGDIKVHRVVCALDCGQVVNPDTVVAQIEGGVVFGLGAALWSEITLEKGRVVQSNFGDYRVMRMNEAPHVEVHIVASHDDPGGIGEPGTAAIAPAVANAVAAATGKRIRKLPLAASAGVLKA
ncbi:xanthine dehydrogenase family protein molybdopterin-binding subunit [Massilia sp. CF038]|uniref:xanthine dehydrogenase family protein molybdopterin-binding subunit n=1 Tax=Massilia sp. CF038 TaxID=1881045 RepID=UPI0009132E41|nr:xanthine dehydrogenase family protein molybdopterin-binding subunit [Massilia sp. CF038]SHG37302.1 isoquinoline 1-oxidoreductase, beta subunit [Massilia sp. CF038]